MKRIVALIVILLSTVPCAYAEPLHTVEYYYENYCESCDPEAAFEEEFKSLTGADLDACDFAAYNTVTEDGQAAFAAMAERFSLKNASVPIAVVDGVVYQGQNAMRSELVRDAFHWGSGLESTVVYLYTPGCESCAAVEKILKDLPETVEARRGDVSFISEVNIIRLDATENASAANALFERYGVEDARRITPSVFLPDYVLSGSERIGKYLVNLVSGGQAVGEISLNGQTEAWSGGGWTPLAAGVIAGFNGCALSMLLLFSSILLKKGKNMLLYGGAFLAAKIACYLLIGFVLLGVMQRLNPTWLIPVSRWILTMIGAGLVFMNLFDAAAAVRGDLGRMKNQLPGRMRSFLHRMIRAITERKVLFPACILLGFAVAAGEFLCAGQIYLASLLQSLQQQDDWTSRISLIWYCIGFALPSGVIIMILARGSSAESVARFMARNIVLVKTATAAAMGALIALAWLV
ncbi:MAG: hypothetical protein IJE08_00460 [Clostridia bacterium]|nr:hypothetical protein [Clostridia bacterium]